jgi:apolipoprotein N-acyltransferase
MPLKQLIGPIMSWLRVPVSDFSIGAAEQSLLELKGQRVGVNICYEDAFAREVLKALPEADWLLNASNDAWFGDSLAPHQHLQIARARAAESGRYLVRATNTGISAVINQRGQLVETIPQFEAEVMQVKVPSYQGKTPYVLWRDWPLMLISLLALAWVWLQLRWHSRDPLGTVRF